MPASIARRIAGAIAGSGIETTRPSGLAADRLVDQSRMRWTQNMSGDL